MRKVVNTTGNKINPSRLPQGLLPQGANPWKDQKFVEAYDQVAQVVNEMPRNPQIKEAMKFPQVAAPIAIVLQAVQEHKPTDEALKLLGNYEREVAEQTKKYLENNLRFSSGQQEIDFSDIAKLSHNLLLGIPSPGQISATSAEWSSFYRDMLGLIDRISQTPQNQALLARLAASALVLTEGVQRQEDKEIRSPFSTIHTYPTTDPTGSPSFLPSAKTLAQTATLVETHGAAAVRDAMNRAREATVAQVEAVTTALSDMLRRDPQNPQKLDNTARAIIGHLARIQQQYGIAIPGIDTQSALTTETRAKAMRPIEELVRAFSSIRQIEESRQRRMSGQSRYTFTPPELDPNAAQAAFHSEYSMYAVGGTKPPTSYEQHSQQQAIQKAPQLQKEFFEEQMNQYYMGVMKMIATIAGIAARKWSSINLANELNSLRSEQAVPNPNQGQVTEIEVPVATGYGSTSVRVTSHEFAGSPQEAPQTTRGYIPIGLPLGQIGEQPLSAQPQLPSTFEEGQVKPTATITVGTKILKISEDAAPDNTTPTIAGANPQQAVDHAVPISKEENQRLLVPIIEVVRTENNTLQVRARLQEITAPTINDQQIETIKDELASLVNMMINNYRQQGGRIPENLLRTFEMAKALQNNPNAQFHSALLRIEQEALENGTIIRRPVLNITFYLPENEVKILQEAARIKTQSSRLRAAGISTGETDTETAEEATERQSQNTRRSQPKLQSVGTYKRSQVLQPTYEETEPEGTSRRQTAADRLVAVSFELSAGNYGELLTDDLHTIEQIILNIYNQFKQQIESGGLITSQQDSTEFVKDLAPGETLKDAIKEATQHLDFQIARRIITTMLDKQIAQRYTQSINAEYAAFLPQARQFPEEFERITQQSALPVEQEGPITFMARPIVTRDAETGEPKLELLVLAYARTTPYLLKIQGTANQAGLISDIANAYMGISQQSFEGRKQYSGGIFARYNLALEDVDGQLGARLVETPIQKGFAPDATLASGAVGLPSGIVTIVGTAGTGTAQMTEVVAEPARQETITQANDVGTGPNTEAGDLNDAALVRQVLARRDANRGGVEADAAQTNQASNEAENAETVAESPAPAAPAPEPSAPTPAPLETSEPQVRKPPEDSNIRRIEDIKLDLTTADENEPKVRIFVIADGGTSNNQGRNQLRATGTGTIVIGIIKDKQSGKKKIKVYRINHYLGNKSTLTNNKAEAFALLTGATLAREMIEALKEEGIIQNANDAEIWMMSDSEVMVGQISGWYEIGNPLLKELVKRTVGTIKNQAGRIRIAHHSKSSENPLGRLIHEVDHLSRIPREDRGGGRYQPLDVSTELEQALNEFNTKEAVQNQRSLTSKVADIGSGRHLNLQNITPIVREENAPLTIVRISDIGEEDTQGELFDLDISDFINDFRQSVGSISQGPSPAPAPTTPAPEPEPAPAASATEPTAPAPAARQHLRVFNKFFGSIKKLGRDPAQQKEWIDIYTDFTSKARITLKHISEGSRGISKQLLMLIGGARRAEHRLDQIVDELQDRPVFASEVVSAEVPDLFGNTPNTRRAYRATPVGQLQARPQATQSAIDPNQPFVSFQGRRDASTDEMIQSFELGQKIARAGGVLVVGGAVGADFAAALGALSEGGKVIIVHFSDFKTDQLGYPEFTRNALTNIYNNTRQYQEDNFMRNIVSRFLNQQGNTLNRTEIFTRLVNKLATLMTLIAVAPNHPVIQELLREINMQLPPTAAVAYYTLRVVSDQPRRTAAESAEIRDKLMVAISDLTVEGPSRGSNSGTAKAVAFAQQIAQQAPDEKAVMTMEEILASDVETISAKITELNEARKRNLEAYKQRQQN